MALNRLWHNNECIFWQSGVEPKGFSAVRQDHNTIAHERGVLMCFVENDVLNKIEIENGRSNT